MAKGLEHEGWRLLSPYGGRDGFAHIVTLVFRSLRRGRYRLVGGRIVCPCYVTHDIHFTMLGQAKMVVHHQRAVVSVLAWQGPNDVGGCDARCPEEGSARYLALVGEHCTFGGSRYAYSRHDLDTLGLQRAPYRVGSFHGIHRH